jgi:hypothetical protein
MTMSLTRMVQVRSSGVQRSDLLVAGDAREEVLEEIEDLQNTLPANCGVNCLPDILEKCTADIHRQHNASKTENTHT